MSYKTSLCNIHYVCALFLVGLEYLKQLNMNGCKYITDTSKLLPVRESLEKLDMGNCVAISDITPLNEMT